MFQKVYLCVVFRAAILGLASADPSQCYSCEYTEACNDPVNLNQIDTCRFSIYQLDNSFGGALLSNFNVSIPSLSLIPVEAKTGSTCTKLIGSSGSKKTIRQCSYKYIDGEESCAFLKRELKKEGLDVVCKNCETDLCNYSSTVSSSIIVFSLMVLLPLLLVLS